MCAINILLHCINKRLNNQSEVILYLYKVWYQQQEITKETLVVESNRCLEDHLATMKICNHLGINQIYIKIILT